MVLDTKLRSSSGRVWALYNGTVCLSPFSSFLPLSSTGSNVGDHEKFLVNYYFLKEREVTYNLIIGRLTGPLYSHLRRPLSGITGLKASLHSSFGLYRNTFYLEETGSHLDLIPI